MNAFLIIKMPPEDRTKTILIHPETKKDKDFSFDFSYWSHDGFKDVDGESQAVPGTHYATQRMVFNDLGREVLNSAYSGANALVTRNGLLISLSFSV